MRRPDPLTPEQSRELDALDRTLAGDPVDADLRELEALVRDVRATSPAMSPAFAARLEHECSEGFPSSAQPARLRRPRRWALLPAAGVLASALVALVVVLGQLGGSDDRGTGVPMAGEIEADSKPSGSAPEAASGGAAKAGDTAASAPPPPAARSAPSSGGANLKLAPPAVGTQANRVRDRQVERSAVIVLVTSDGKFQSTSDGVVRTVDRFGGIVASSNIGSSDSNGGEATFDLRIPTDRLDDALAALSKLGHVAERSQNLEDITGSFSSAQERLSDARAERRGLLRALGRATTQQQVNSLRAQLRLVGSRISGLKGQLASLRRRADLSTVSVTVRGGGSESEGGMGGGDSWTPGDAARDAVRVLEVIAGVVLISLAILGPLALLGAIVAYGARLGRRRSRDRALEAA